MEELNRKTIDRAVLVGLNADCFTKEETATETTLDELEALLNTAGGECAGKVLQNKHTPDPRSFIGEGKAEEVRQLVLETGANMVIFDNDLTPSQTRTLEDILKTTVLDRSALILDIFAQRAKTRLYVACESEATGWTAVGVAYTQELLRSQDRIYKTYLLIAAAALVLALVFALQLSRSIAEPIRRLMQTMRRDSP